MGYDVITRSIGGAVTALGAADCFTLVVDRPVEAGGGGLGFNGGQLLNMSVAACVSNDLFREAAKRGLQLTSVVVRVSSDYVGDPATSTDIGYSVELAGVAPTAELRALVDHVNQIAEIPASIRRGTPVHMTDTQVTGTD